MKFFYYCFYRLTNAYKASAGKQAHMFAAILVSFVQSGNLLSLLAILCILNDYQLDDVIMKIVPGTLIFINLFFVLTKNKYAILAERWKNETLKYKKLKLWLIWLYVVFSFIITVILGSECYV